MRVNNIYLPLKLDFFVPKSEAKQNFYFSINKRPITEIGRFSLQKSSILAKIGKFYNTITNIISKFRYFLYKNCVLTQSKLDDSCNCNADISTTGFHSDTIVCAT